MRRNASNAQSEGYDDRAQAYRYLTSRAGATRIGVVPYYADRPLSADELDATPSPALNRAHANDLRRTGPNC